MTDKLESRRRKAEKQLAKLTASQIAAHGLPGARKKPDPNRKKPTIPLMLVHPAKDSQS